MGCDPDEFEQHPPHDNIGRPYRDILPRGRSARAEAHLSGLRVFLEQSRRQIQSGPEGASMLWPWSASRRPDLPSFTQRWGLTAGLVCGMDFLNGIAHCAGIVARPVPGATAYIDTDYAAKRLRAIDFVERFDVVLVHVNAPDEESHQGDLAGKIRSIELIDRWILGPIHDHLLRRHPGRHRIAVLPDHYTRLRDRRHGDEPVPVALCGAGIEARYATRYSEQAAAGPVVPAHLWLEHFLAREAQETPVRSASLQPNPVQS